jgi:hypothetical protein
MVKDHTGAFGKEKGFKFFGLVGVPPSAHSQPIVVVGIRAAGIAAKQSPTSSKCRSK